VNRNRERKSEDNSKRKKEEKGKENREGRKSGPLAQNFGAMQC
jgi:hypothetical protein